MSVSANLLRLTIDHIVAAFFFFFFYNVCIIRLSWLEIKDCSHDENMLVTLDWHEIFFYKIGT